MIVCGCDLGSATGKAVLLEDDRILARAVVKSRMNPEQTAKLVIGEALKQINVKSIEEIEYIVGTGYGREHVSFINENVSEISCHARGAKKICPEVKTVIDIGGQDCKVIAVGKTGKVLEFVMNDKCAAGTGRFFEAMSRVFDMSISELAELAMQSDSPVSITKQCSVFAESEVVTLMNRGEDIRDVAAGIHDSIARRIFSLMNRIDVNTEVLMTGGCARNRALHRSIEKICGITLYQMEEDPQIIGALGAAVYAQQKAG